jgi:rare lipoprotein A (peptidoglycan hydrolase)
MVSRNFCRAERVRLVCIALGASALAAVLLPVKFATPAEAKTPGETYCYHGICHRVKTIEETQALVGVEESIAASHYDDCSVDVFNPCGLTSSGERFHPDRPDNTASPIYPDGTTLLVWSPDTERALIVRVNNAGPYWGDRMLDLSRAAAEKLGFEGKGVANVQVRVIKAPEPEEASYVADRNYGPVPGDIGEYATLEEAQFGMAVALALQASAASPFAPVTTANAFAVGTNRAEPLVAEAPQALGRGRMQLASSAEAAGGFGSVTLGGHAMGGTLFKGIKLRQSRTQSRYELAQLNFNRELNQSVWDEDRLKDTPAKAPDWDGDTTAAATSLTTGSVPEKVVKEAADTTVATPTAALEKDAKEVAETAAADNETDSKAAEREQEREETAEQPSRKSHAERRSRASRTAKSERRRARPQVAFTSRSYERRPERTAEQTTSAGIRAQASSTM